MSKVRQTTLFYLGQKNQLDYCIVVQTINYSVMSIFKKASHSTVRLNERNSPMFLDFPTDKYFSINVCTMKAYAVVFKQTVVQVKQCVSLRRAHH